MQPSSRTRLIENGHVAIGFQRARCHRAATHKRAQPPTCGRCQNAAAEGASRCNGSARKPRQRRSGCVAPISAHSPNGSATWRSPSASGHRFPRSTQEPRAGLSPSSCRSPLGRSAGTLSQANDRSLVPPLRPPIWAGARGKRPGKGSQRSLRVPRSWP